MKVLGISGSLRAGALNTTLLHALRCMAESDMEIQVLTLEDLPFYNEDIDVPGKVPAAAQRLRDLTAAADGLICATPEYSRAISGVMKNALDWLCRPTTEGVIQGKCALALCATESMNNGLSAQVALTTLLRHLGAYVPEPEYVFHQADARMATYGDLRAIITEPTSRQQMEFQLKLLATAIRSDLGTQFAQHKQEYYDVVVRPRRLGKTFPLQIQKIPEAPRVAPVATAKSGK